MIRIPGKDEYQACAINDIMKDELISFGYVRGKRRQRQLSDHLFPPEYLIRIIYGYYWNECIHLFGLYSFDHHKIDVLALFDR